MHTGILSWLILSGNCVILVRNLNSWYSVTVIIIVMKAISTLVFLKHKFEVFRRKPSIFYSDSSFFYSDFFFLGQFSIPKVCFSGEEIITQAKY